MSKLAETIVPCKEGGRERCIDCDELIELDALDKEMRCPECAYVYNRLIDDGVVS